MDAPERTLESRLKALGTLEGVTKDNPRIVLWRKLWAEVAALEQELREAQRDRDAEAAAREGWYGEVKRLRTAMEQLAAVTLLYRDKLPVGYREKVEPVFDALADEGENDG